VSGIGGLKQYLKIAPSGYLPHVQQTGLSKKSNPACPIPYVQFVEIAVPGDQLEAILKKANEQLILR